MAIITKDDVSIDVPDEYNDSGSFVCYVLLQLLKRDSRFASIKLWALGAILVELKAYSPFVEIFPVAEPVTRRYTGSYEKTMTVTCRTTVYQAYNLSNPANADLNGIIVDVGYTSTNVFNQAVAGIVSEFNTLLDASYTTDGGAIGFVKSVTIRDSRYIPAADSRNNYYHVSETDFEILVEEGNE